MRRKVVAWTLFLTCSSPQSCRHALFQNRGRRSSPHAPHCAFDSSRPRAMEESARTARESRSCRFRCWRPFSATLSPLVSRRMRITHRVYPRKRDFCNGRLSSLRFLGVSALYFPLILSCPARTRACAKIGVPAIPQGAGTA
jgi:hypothetical protein